MLPLRGDRMAGDAKAQNARTERRVVLICFERSEGMQGKARRFDIDEIVVRVNGMNVGRNRLDGRVRGCGEHPRTQFRPHIGGHSQRDTEQ